MSWPAVRTRPVPEGRSLAWPLLLGTLLSSLAAPLLAFWGLAALPWPNVEPEPAPGLLGQFERSLPWLDRAVERPRWLVWAGERTGGFTSSVLLVIVLGLMLTGGAIGVGTELARRALRVGRAGWLVAVRQRATLAGAPVMLAITVVAADSFGRWTMSGALDALYWLLVFAAAGGSLGFTYWLGLRLAAPRLFRP